MPQISLPSRGEVPYDGKLNAAIQTVNQEVDRTAAEVSGRLGEYALSRTIAALAPRGRTSAVFNVLAFGAVIDGDASSATLAANKNAIVAARNAAAQWTPGTAFGHIHAAVYVPGGVYNTYGDVVWQSGVSLFGDGIGRTIFRPHGTDAAARMFYVGSETDDPANPLTDATFSDFEIDGSEQEVTGTYNTGAKGFHGKWMRRVIFNRVLVRETAASGFGVDHHANVKFTDCIAINCGRLNDGSKPGGAGFGIGAGAYATEDVVLHGCTAIGCGTFGVFFETQDAPNDNPAYGAKITSSHFENNQVANIANAGVTGMVIGGCTLKGGRYGIFVGPRLTDHVGHDIVIGTTLVDGAAVHGIHVDHQFEGAPGTGSTRMGIKIDESVIVSNCGQAGINIVPRLGQVLRDFTIKATTHDNGWPGVRFAGEGTVAQFQIGGMHYNNCKASGTPSQGGVMFGCNVSYGSVRGAQFWDTVGNQMYGVDYLSGITATQVHVVGNDMDNVPTSGIRSTGSIRVACRWVENSGYNNPASYSSIAVPASGAVIPAIERPRDLYIVGGTVSQIQVDDETVAVSNPATMTLPLSPGQTARITYSVAPSAIKQYLR